LREPVPSGDNDDYEKWKVLRIEKTIMKIYRMLRIYRMFNISTIRGKSSSFLLSRVDFL